MKHIPNNVLISRVLTKITFTISAKLVSNVKVLSVLPGDGFVNTSLIDMKLCRFSSNLHDRKVILSSVPRDFACMTILDVEFVKSGLFVQAPTKHRS